MIVDVDRETKEKWQKLANSIADLLSVPAVLVMHLTEDDISVFVSSQSEGNPYNEGASEHFDGSGLYCEWVIKNQERLLVPNALNDPDWENNPDVGINMISYLGFPVNYPDGTPFGTFCILDRRENSYSEKVENFLSQIKTMIEDHLLLLTQRQKLFRTLNGLLPLCASCKKVRDSDDNWVPVDQYIVDHSEARVSHGMCPECAKIYLNMK